jgi:hypothetical protein
MIPSTSQNYNPKVAANGVTPPTPKIAASDEAKEYRAFSKRFRGAMNYGPAILAAYPNDIVFTQKGNVWRFIFTARFIPLKGRLEK